MDSATIHREFQTNGFPQLCDKEITFVRSNDIMLYAREKHTSLSIGRKVRSKYDIGSKINARVTIQ
jgi:hypothetical protein